MAAETAVSPGLPATPARQRSLWAIASLVCAVVVVCPIFSLIGLVLAAVAALDLRRHPHRTGKRLVVAALFVSVLALGGQALALRWWHVHARRPMLYGPADALLAGQGGDVAGFRAAFVTGGEPVSEQEAVAFLSAVAERYGRLGAMVHREDAAEPVSDFRRAAIPYTYFFENGPVDVDAEFVVQADDGSGLVLRFAWMIIRDEALGDLAYPKSAAPERSGSAEPSTPSD